MPDVMQYTVQYELLRTQVIGSVGDIGQGNTKGQARGIGLALLLSEGMPGWLKAVEGVLRASLQSRRFDLPSPVPYEGPTANNVVPTWMSSVQRNKATALLASLILSTRPLTPQSSREGYRSW
jgi:hypothetical protein